MGLTTTTFQTQPSTATLGLSSGTGRSCLVLEVNSADSMDGSALAPARVAASVHAKLVENGSWIIVSGKQPSELLSVLGKAQAVQLRTAGDRGFCHFCLDVAPEQRVVSPALGKCLFLVAMLVQVEGTTIAELQKIHDLH